MTIADQTEMRCERKRIIIDDVRQTTIEFWKMPGDFWKAIVDDEVMSKLSGEYSSVKVEDI